MDIRCPPNTLTDFLLPHCFMIKNSAHGLCMLEIGHVLNVKIH
jgi:hypothetical protein